MSRVYDGFITIDGVWHLARNREHQPPAAWRAERYERDVSTVLDHIFLLSHTGAALRHSITQELDILPWVGSEINARASDSIGPATPRSGIPPHLQHLLTTLATHGVVHGRVAGPIGRGVSVCDCPDRLSCLMRRNLYIYYTQELYQGYCRRAEALLHEMVHSVRRMASLPMIPHIDLYDNMDEFAAILVTNYYSGEHGRGIRNSHQGHAPISCTPRQWLNARVSPRAEPNRHYLEIFCSQQPDLADRLADSPQTTFNPVRQMRGGGP